jgi:hypothetical protein
MFAHAGTARLDIFTDSLLLEVGEDLFLARLSRLSPLMQGRTAYCPLSRRYQGTAGHYCDVEQGIGLRRSKHGAALIFVERGTIYSIPVVEVREVLHGVRSECGISRVLTTEARTMGVEA